MKPDIVLKLKDLPPPCCPCERKELRLRRVKVGLTDKVGVILGYPINV